jgi:NAD(P)-dependent dehydrogenase (short-subunit alcohol dehydrogenase family)
MRLTELPASQQTILITGCSTGIGYYTAKRLHDEGYRVFATARKPTDVARLQSEGLNAHQLDVRDPSSIDTALEWVLDQTDGQLFALFNNGAYGQPGAVEDLSREVLKEQFETNVFGWHDLTCKVLKVMRQQGYGRIVQNSSVLGLISMKYRGAYNASKYAIEGLTDTMRQELDGSDIHIALVEPGPIRSEFRNNAYQKFKDNIDTQNSAHRAVYQSVEKRLSAKTAGAKSPDEDAPFTLGPDEVYMAVFQAFNSKSPKAHYYVTFPTYLFGYLKRVLPTKWLDRLLIKISESENK